MIRRALCFVCPVILGPLVMLAPAQERSYDALAHARARALAQNQRILLLLTGGEEDVGAALGAAMKDCGRLLRYEYQLVALPASSQPGTALRQRLELGELALPALAVLSAADEVLSTLTGKEMTAGGSFAPDRVRTFLQEPVCAPLDARKVLADGLAVAKQDGRHVFVYLSAPW